MIWTQINLLFWSQTVEASLLPGWACDRPWEARKRSVLVLSPPAIGSDRPQHSHLSPPTARAINPCLLIQCERTFAPGSRRGHFSGAWSRSISVLPFSHERIDVLADHAVMKAVMFFAALTVITMIIKLIGICVSAPFWQFVPRRWRSEGCLPTIIHISRPLFLVTFRHVTLRGQRHFIFYLQSVAGETLRLMHVPTGTCVLLKETPIHLWALPINANHSHIIGSLDQPHNICSDKLAELQSDLTSFYIAMYPWMNYETGPGNFYVVILVIDSSLSL